RALDKDPELRFASCTEFIGELARAGSRPTLALDDTPADPALAGTAGGDVTPRKTPALVKKAESLADYQLLTRLGTTPVAGTWQARSPAGRERLIKFIFGFDRQYPQAEAAAVARLAGLSPPTLVPAEVLQRDPGRLVLATDLVRTSLRDRFQE